MKVGFRNNLQYLVNGLIDSGGPRGKVAQNEELYHAVRMVWTCAINYTIPNPLECEKHEGAPPVDDFF